MPCSDEDGGRQEDRCFSQMVSMVQKEGRKRPSFLAFPHVLIGWQNG